MAMTRLQKLKAGLTRVATNARRRRRANRAVRFLRRQHRRRTWRCPVGWHDNSGRGVPWDHHCAHTVACAYGRAASGWDAYQGWQQTIERHRRDGRSMHNPPRGAVCFAAGPPGSPGHVWISNGRGRAWTNDAPATGRIGLVPHTWFAQHWGPAYKMVGWVWPDELPGWG